MKNPSDILADFFTKAQWEHEVTDSQRWFCSRFTGKSGRWSFIVVVADDKSGVLVLSFLPAIVPVSRHPACLDLLNRINYAYEHDP